jgi:hypothetical protein
MQANDLSGDTPRPKLKAVAATAQETAAAERAAKAIDESLPLQNDFLQKLLTMNVALIGGGFLLAKGEILPYWFGVATLATLMASLIATLLGLAPEEGKGDIYSHETVKEYQRFEKRRMAKKTAATKWTLIFICAAFAVALTGLMVKGASQPKVIEERCTRSS